MRLHAGARGTCVRATRLHVRQICGQRRARLQSTLARRVGARNKPLPTSQAGREKCDIAAGQRRALSKVPVHCGAPQRHAQSFFNRAVWATSSVMP